MKRIDLNCDLGEGAGHDAELMPLISSANIACGAHAGDLETMRATVALARRHGVAIGAHPGFADRENFGRKEMTLAPSEIRKLVSAQIEALMRIGPVRHVKLHGALYNMAARDALVADAVAKAVQDLEPRLKLVTLPDSALACAGRARNLQIVNEVFADRTYQGDGHLTPRARADALIHDEGAAVAQVLGMVRDGVVHATDGKAVAIRADTVCLHGDAPNAVAFARRLNAELRQVGFTLRAFL